ncbi:hypothetical protein I4100191B2_18250 [Clostridiales bacterium]
MRYTGRAGENALHLGVAGGRKTKVRRAEGSGQAYPSEKASGVGQLMSQIKK